MSCRKPRSRSSTSRALTGPFGQADLVLAAVYQGRTVRGRPRPRRFGSTGTSRRAESLRSRPTTTTPLSLSTRPRNGAFV